MKKIEVVYSPLCEATGAFIGKLKEWLKDTAVEIEVIPFHEYEKRGHGALKENCFVDVYYNGKIIDSVPLHQEVIYKELGIQQSVCTENEFIFESAMSEDDFYKAVLDGEIQFYPIDCHSYQEEMMMCLCNYPYGNPPKKFHDSCIRIKEQVYSEVWKKEEIAGIYAKYKEKVVGLLEIMPREIIRKYGYMTGTKGNDEDYLTVGCYEVGSGMPRVAMIDVLQKQLIKFYPCFRRKLIEGVGIYGWNDGFNPYWVYEKYGYRKVDELAENTIVLEKEIE